MARTEYKTIFVGKKEIHSTTYNGACLPGFVSCHTISHKAAVASLSHRWSLIRLHLVRQRKGRMCIISPFDDVEAARPDLRYPPFSLTKLWRGRAFATCSLPQYGQIPAAGALLVTSR